MNTTGWDSSYGIPEEVGGEVRVHDGGPPSWHCGTPWVAVPQPRTHVWLSLFMTSQLRMYTINRWSRPNRGHS